jgi:hypothetical protein
MSALRFITGGAGVLGALLLLSGVAEATPRMSLTAGTPCTACHHSPNGAGARTDIGWGSMNHVGALTYAQLGLQKFHNVDSNTWLDGAVSVSLDARLQTARLGSPALQDQADGSTTTTYPDYTTFPMQFQPSIAVMPMEGLTLLGSYLAGPGARDGDFCDPAFPGMPCYQAFAKYELGGRLPTVRVGMFQPSIGIQHDDHTLLIRGDAKRRRTPIIPPFYSELGAEIIAQPIQWLRAEVGGFASKGLDDALNTGSETADLSAVAYSARVTVLPHFEFGGAAPSEADEFADDFDDEAPPAEPFVLNTWLGASIYGSGDFRMVNGFLGLGHRSGVAFLAEVAHTTRTIDYETLNGFVGLSYSLFNWLTFNARAERAQTTEGADEALTTAYVGGLEFFPLPYVEIRPEYRLTETADYRFGQATVQVHLFY